MAEDQRESGFVIDGESYAIPTLDSLTLDEERLLYLYADCVVQDFASPHPDWSDEDKNRYEYMLSERVRNPNLKRALAHIAYHRKHPDMSDEEILDAIGKVRALELDRAMLRPQDEDPTKVSQSKPLPTSGPSEPERSMVSGRHTDTNSGQAEESQEDTGTTESDTSSPQLRAIG